MAPLSAVITRRESPESPVAKSLLRTPTPPPRTRRTARRITPPTIHPTPRFERRWNSASRTVSFRSRSVIGNSVGLAEAESEAPAPRHRVGLVRAGQAQLPAVVETDGADGR